MTKLYHVLFIMAIIVVGVESGYVPCPNVTNLTGCQTCYQYTPLSPIECTCWDVQFSILGRCMRSGYPCITSLISVTIDPNVPRYELWTPKIAPFWTKKFEQAKNSTTQPSPRPTILNDYNFTNMTIAQKLGWTQAYFMYQAFKVEIESKSLSQQHQKLFQAVVLMEALLGQNNTQKWQNITKFVNLTLNKNYNASQFSTETYLRVVHLAPCQRCQDMYGIIVEDHTSRCSKCPTNCKNCTNNTSLCAFCQPGFYLKDGKCIDCDKSQCAACNATNCLKCVAGYSLINGNCQQCQDGCTNCVDQASTVCTKCTYIFYGQKPKDNGQCVTCATQCLVCDPTNTTKCLQCQDYYYLNSTSGACVACGELCIECSAQGCVSCIYGYGMVNNTCQRCVKPGCVSCNGHVEACTAWVARYFQYNYTTETCQLTNATTEYLDYYNQKLDCRAGCDYCYNNDTSKCFQCHDRYYTYNNYYCKKCMPGCLQCSNSTTCLTPITGYVISNGVSVKCPNNCRECSPTNTSTCFYCRQGYKKVGNNCVPNNRPECLAFEEGNNNQKCLICMPGYTLTPAGICIQCLSGCNWSCNPQNISECRHTRFELAQWFLFQYSLGNQGCNGQVNGNCLQAEQGFKLVKNNNTYEVALECLYPCADCTATACLSCEDGYIFSNGQCTVNFSCNPNCTQCLAGSERNPTNNFCIACPVENCSSCLNGVCLECFEGYFFDGQKCSKCPSKCRVCYDANNCNICAVGYLWPIQWRDYAYDCVKCDSNCKTCKFEANTCTQCYAGMKLINFRCRKQFNLAFTYTLNYDYEAFVTNMKSEVLIGAIMRILGVSYSDVFITNITKGSTIVSCVVSALNEQAGRNLFKKLKNSQMSEFDVKGLTIYFNDDDKPLDCTSSGKTQGCPLNPGAIAGIVIGCLLAVIGIVVGIYCYRKHKQNTPDTPGSDLVQIKSDSTKSYGAQSQTHLQRNNL